MIKEIVKDNFFLSLKSETATKDDISVANDLIDTIIANKERCVGLAANMIGVLKTILVFLDSDNKYKIMINPKIVFKSDMYATTEGCLSHDGAKDCIRYNKIKVEFFDIDLKKRIKTYTDITAEIIQHEMDHFDGILI